MKALLFSLFLLLSLPTQFAMAQTQTQNQPPKKRCEATTKKGTRCKLEAIDNSKFCYVHQAKAPNVQQCKAKTKSGSRCSRAAKTSGYCTQHYKMYQEGKLKQ